jgi:two-component system, OmpR family, sensor histidine kinase KdpD
MTVTNVLRADHQRGPKSVSAPSSQALSRRPAGVLIDPDDSATHRFDPGTQSGGESELLVATAHELRLPLSQIRGFVSSLRRTDLWWDVKTRLDFLAEIDAETDRLVHLVDSLLPARGASADSVFASPCDIVAGGLYRVRGLLGQRELRVEVSRRLPTVRMDARQMERVVANLVENATKYSSPGSTIVISARIAANGDLELSVDNDGPGIPAEARERFFEPFFRRQMTKQSQAPGHALALATCKSIVEAHGGHIWVYDHPVKGTRFSVVLPPRLYVQRLDEFPVSWQIARSRQQWTSPRSWE